MANEIQFTVRAKAHLKALRKRDQKTILDTVEEQLRFEAETPTRNRKRLQDNPLAPWELRIGDFRVFYDVDEEVVRIVAVGEKTHNVLLIGGEEVEL
ncbi:MAG: type II toxin-antitoxin system RelE/ParE family toxin [Gemmataceae bacterium]|nr:type II toxin-antitoxin system RelE/ParE family toxin [Gemmataceae bacterium]MCI0739963.1 type II toxin-antitoxin system RelE/ParE family toxin [Gemmataceae bacterium]